MSTRWRGPAEGWLSLVLLVFLAFIVGYAVDDAAWVLGRTRLTDFLPTAAILGTLVGFTTAQLGWGRLRAHLSTAVVAAVVVPLLVGSALQPEQSDLLSLFQATAASSVDAFIDLIVHGRGSTVQYGHYLLVLGLLMWATGHFAAYAVYRHHHPFSAAVAFGLALVVNMSLTPKDQLNFLVLFTVAALLLLVTLHAFDERRDWLRRRIGDPGPLTALTLRGGSAFVLAAVFGSLVLTSTAASAPLRDAWIGAEPWLVDVGRQLEQWFPALSRPRGPAGVDFGTTATITATWTNDSSVAAIITRPADGIRYYWRAAAYDRFDGHSWTASQVTRASKAENESLLAGSAEQAAVATGRTSVTVSVEPQAYPGPQILSPSSPSSIDLGTHVSLIGSGGYVASVAADQRGIPYTVTASYPTFRLTEAEGITENKLRVAGTTYPDSVKPYLAWSAIDVGPSARALLATVQAQLPKGKDDPYDWAKAMETYLRGSDFTYTTDVSGLDCTGISAVECFARFRKGFCQYYASTMAMLLRVEGIPTRYIQGFLPGHLDAGGTTETIVNGNSHAWVEVYFPGYGWIPFDPTGSVAQLQSIPEGPPVATPTPSPSPSGSPAASGDNGLRTRRPESVAPGGGGGSTTPGAPGSAPFIVVGILLAAGMGWLAFAAWRRGPRDVTADGAWGSVTRIARRLGFGQRPTQTVYEYSATLAELLPAVRPELETVARAKVEVTYGHHPLGEDRVVALRAAVGRLRIGLLRLALRRPRRR